MFCNLSVSQSTNHQSWITFQLSSKRYILTNSIITNTKFCTKHRFDVLIFVSQLSTSKINKTCVVFHNKVFLLPESMHGAASIGSCLVICNLPQSLNANALTTPDLYQKFPIDHALLVFTHLRQYFLFDCRNILDSLSVFCVVFKSILNLHQHDINKTLLFSTDCLFSRIMHCIL